MSPTIRWMRPRRVLGAVLALVLALAAAACGGGSGGSSSGGSSSGGGGAEASVPSIKVPITPTDIPIAVAADQHLFKGINVSYQVVGFDAKTPLFLKNKDADMPVVELSPVEVASEIAKGEDIAYFSTADGLYFWNGIVVRAKDAGKYRSIPDLKGLKVGQPGFSTGTWAAFAAVSKSLYGLDARKDFKLVTADPGALLGLLAAGKIDAALTFASQAATGLASSKFKLIAPLGTLWQQKSGEPLSVGGLAASRSWLQKNPEAARQFVAGVDRGVQWMKDHPDEFRSGGKYAKLAGDQGWLADKQTTDQILKLLTSGRWYFTSKLYTSSWMDANYRFAALAQEASGEPGKAPPKDKLFYAPGGGS